MSLKTRPRPPAYSRKRQGMHHKQGKRYIKPYLPYLPMLAIITGGFLLNRIWMPGNANADSIAGAEPLTRLAIISGNRSTTLLYSIIFITLVAFLIFLFTHWYRLHKVINRGEIFIIEHPWFDVSLVTIVTVGVLLTRR